MPAELERPERLQIMLNAEELAAVDDFRFQKRMPSRAAAVRELMKRGLAAAGFSVAGAGEKSTSFGVLGAKATGSRKGNGARDHGDAPAADGDESKRQPSAYRSRP
ncbi:MAG: hypothetical protein ACLQJR_17995 [Stellaceae bacterium]